MKQGFRELPPQADYTLPPSVDAMVEGCPEVQVVEFCRAVRSFGHSFASEPETALYHEASKSKPSRTARMWYTPRGLVVLQKYGLTIIPLSNVLFVKVA